MDKALADTTDLIIAAESNNLAPAEETIPHTEQFGATSLAGGISQKAYDLILEFEVSSKEIYEKKFRQPVWPAVKSGVTIGIGYDVGYATKDQLRNDWAGVIDDAMITALERAIGVTGAAAKPLANQLKGIVDVPWSAAIQVHSRTVIPRWVALVQKALPNTASLSANSLGALVSLTYNRGAGGYKSAKARFKEMAAIRRHMTDNTKNSFAGIPAQIQSMKRLWPGIGGLLRRRDREAQLFKDGLSQPPGGGQPPAGGAHVALNTNAMDAQTVIQRLTDQIANKKITFQDPRFKTMLLGNGVTAKLQFLVLKLSELASPIEISSVVRGGDAGHHGTGRAVDVGNEMEIATALLSKVANQQLVDALHIDEIIFDAARIGAANSQQWNFDRGQPHEFDGRTMGQHGNHIHFAVKA